MRSRLVLVALALFAAAAARANPVSIAVVRARQVPHTTHVQVTFAVDGSISADYVPTALLRDGQPVPGTFQLAAGPFRTNTGSGVRDTRAKQVCDCAVTAGKHAYTLTYRVGQNPETLSTTVEVVQGLGDPPDAAGGPVDMLPWEIPDPVEIQGLDCKQACAAPPPADMALQINPMKNNACSLGASHGFGGAGALVVLCAFLLLGRRRD